MTITTTMHPILGCLLLAAVLLCAGCIADGQSFTGPATGFLSETTAHDDRVEFRFVPDSD